MDLARQTIIADGQFLTAEALRNFLISEFGIRVNRIVHNKADLIKAVLEEPQSLLIIDHNRLDFNDFSEFRRFLQDNSLLPVMVLTNALSRNELSDLNAAGVKNILFKTATREEVAAAIKSLLAGKKYFCQEILDMLTEKQQEKGIIREHTSLTQTEIEIVKAVAEGLTTKQIAAGKYISYHTVMTHRKNIFRKLKINNASELVMYAIRTGIIDAIEYNI